MSAHLSLRSAGLTAFTFDPDLVGCLSLPQCGGRPVAPVNLSLSTVADLSKQARLAKAGKPILYRVVNCLPSAFDARCSYCCVQAADIHYVEM